MNPSQNPSIDERYLSLLVAGEQALGSESTFELSDVPSDLQDELKRDLACVDLLREVLPALAPESAYDPLPLNGAPSAPSGTCLGRFHIRHELGRGTFGIVYLAYDPSLEREVALKVPRIDALVDPEMRKRFYREAKAAAGLKHPNVVPVYEAGEAGPVCYIASEYCAGVTLARWLKERNEPVPFRLAASLVARLAEAVDHAHQNGVVHRDLKPGNVLLGPLPEAGDPELTPKITDFGLARFMLAADTSQTGSGTMLGTPNYMAPEQAGGRSREIGPAADIYALGVILYELLTGRPPFQAESVVDTLVLVRTQEPVAPGRLRARLPRDLETICLTAMAKNPARRFKTAGAMAEDLQRWLDKKPIHARPISSLERLVYWARRRPAIAALLIAILVVGAVGVAGIAWQWQRAETAADDLEINLYFRNVALAEREWSANNMARADQLLDACPLRRRGWEWHYVRHLRLNNLPPLHGHKSVVSSVSVSPDSTRIASASLDKTVTIWDVRSGRPLQTFAEHTEQVRVVIFIDDERVVSGSMDGTIKVWNATTGAVLRDIRTANRVWRLALSPDGQRLASASNNKWTAIREPGPNELQIWDVATWELLKSIPLAPRLSVNGMAFSADGQRIAFASGDIVSGEHSEVSVLDATTGTTVLTLPHPTGANCLAYSPDGRFLASGSGTFRSDEGKIHLWDAKSGRLIRTLEGHTGTLSNLAFSPDSRRLASSSADKKVKIWDVASGLEAINLHGHTDNVWGLTFSPDGHRLVSSGTDQTVRVWDASPLEKETGSELASLIGSGGRDNPVAMSGDGQFVASAGADAIVRVWSAKTWNQIHALHGHNGRILSLDFSADSQFLVSGGEDGSARIWDVATGQQRYVRVELSDIECRAAFRPDGWLAAIGGNNALIVWDPGTGKEWPIRNVHEWRILGLAFSPNGKYLATVSADCTVKVWNAQTQTSKPVLHAGPFTGRILHVAFSPDSRRLAFCGMNQTATVWDAVADKEVVTFRGHTDQVNWVCFSPDGRRVASASNDGTIKVWDAESGKEIETIRGHTRWVNGVVFSPDGQYLVSASADGTVKVWKTPP